MLFEWQWWVLLATLIIPLVIWWKLVDKDRFFQIAFFGFLAFLIALETDMLGHQLGLWHYPHRLVFIGPRLMEIDISLFPVTYMLVYQYFQSWKRYLIAAAIVTLTFSFVGEPLLVYMGIYELITWKHWYSLPIYFLIFVFLKWFVDKLIILNLEACNKYHLRIYADRVRPVKQQKLPPISLAYGSALSSSQS
ncbi:MAG: CBO0543 family protein [Syntrophomonadaceae bacterium]